MASSVGVTRLRRRLSRIFQRPISGSGLRLRPWRDGTNGNSQNRICQSPRIQRCWRRACVRTLDGYSSTISHVGDERHPRMQPFEQIVRQQRVLRHAVLERRHEGVHVVQALAREDAFAEQILIRVGHRRGVRIHARVPRVQPREQRARRARERDAHARLQNAVAFGDAARPRVERRPVQRMGDDADQLPRGIAGQAGVAVERDAVPHAAAARSCRRRAGRSWCRSRPAAAG